MLDAINDASENDEEKLARLEQFSVIDQLANIATDSKIDAALKAKALDSLRNMAKKHKRIAEKLAAKEKFAGDLINVNIPTEAIADDQQRAITLNSLQIVKELLNDENSKKNYSAEDLCGALGSLLK